MMILSQLLNSATVMLKSLRQYGNQWAQLCSNKYLSEPVLGQIWLAGCSLSTLAIDFQIDYHKVTVNIPLFLFIDFRETGKKRG